jgi:hypothetical protein
VDDGVGGNGDGLLDTGEWADLHVELYNAGDTAATNVAVDVESLSANLVVHQPGAALPDLDSGQSGTTQSPHPRVRLATSHTCAEPVDLQFSYSADGHARSESTTLSTGCQIYDPVPNPVQTLRLNLDASDVVLSWLRPGLDPAHGEADRYRVYRSTMPDSGWTLAVELHDSAEELSHSDPDGAGGAELVFYQVIAGNDAGDAEALP